MKRLKNFPFWVAFYVSAVGLAFGIMTVFQVPRIHFKEPNRYFMMGISFILFLFGVRYGYLAIKGKLEPKGISVKEVRKQALEKIESVAYLAKTAKDDPDPGVRKTALKRLEEISNQG